jgi:hypothetical protein
MGKIQTNTRLDQDTADSLTQYCEEMDMTKAEVLRRATRDYLEEHAEQDDDDLLDDAMHRHGVAPSASVVIRVAILFLAIFAGGSAWEAGTAFGDFLTVVGVF